MAHRATRMSTFDRPRFKPNQLTRSVAYGILAASMASPTLAVEFNIGEIEGRFDSQLSVGSSWRLDDASSDLISVPNGGTSKGSGSYDDGDLNFKEGKAFSTVFKGVHDLELNCHIDRPVRTLRGGSFANSSASSSSGTLLTGAKEIFA